MDQTIRAIANHMVERNHRYSQVNDILVLRTAAVRIVATEHQCYWEGTSESTSLDGLTATTFTAREQGSDDEMDYE